MQTLSLGLQRVGDCVEGLRFAQNLVATWSSCVQTGALYPTAHASHPVTYAKAVPIRCCTA